LLLSERDSTSKYTLDTLIKHYNKISKDIFKKAIIKLSEKEIVAGRLCFFLCDNYNVFSSDIVNKALLNLSNFIGASQCLSTLLLQKFDLIEEEIRNKILLELSRYDYDRFKNSATIQEECKFLDENNGEEYIKLSSQNLAFFVLHIVELNFDKISLESINSLLLRYSSIVDSRDKVFIIVQSKIDKLTNNYTNVDIIIQILSNLKNSGNDDIGKESENLINTIKTLKNANDAINKYRKG